MSDFFDFCLIFLSFLLCAVWSGKVLRYCQKQNMVCAVNNRSSHTTPTPRGGGLALVIITLPAMFLFAYFAELAPMWRSFVYALAGCSAVIALLGWLDDKHNLRALVRFPVQMVCIGVCLYFLPTLFDGYVSFYTEKFVLFLAWAWFLNLYNFMDGIDGILGMQTVFLAAAVILLVATPFKPIFLVLAGCGLGFLRVNWHPAKIFMGDVGSTFLGFVFAGLLLASAHFPTNINTPSIYVLFALPMLFTGDATYTLFKRILQLKKPWQAHKEHWYQRAVQAGYSHAEVVKRAIFINVFIFIICVFSIALGFTFTTIILCALVLIFAAGRIRYLEGK